MRELGPFVLAALAALGSAATAAEVHRAARPVPGQYIVVLKDGAARDSNAADGDSTPTVRQVVAAMAERFGIEAVGHVYEHALAGFSARIPEARLAALANDPRVAFVEEAAVVSVAATQSPVTWGLDRIDQRALPLSGSYSYPSGAGNVHAYVIDTGILPSHPDFGGRASVAFDASGGDGIDCHGHGTHVAGTVGSATWGVAKEVRLHGVKVFLGCTGDGTNAEVIAGVDWVTGNHVKPAVANMSLAGDVDPALDAAVQGSIAAGVFYAVAAANANADACFVSPARVPEAVTVGSTTSSDARSGFSNFGACVDLFAPGSAIESTYLGGGSAALWGTSMASPHVAGAGALYLADHPLAAPAEVASALLGAATPGVVTNPGAGSPNRLLFVCPAITVTNPPVAAATVGTSFAQTFTQSGATGTPTFTTASPLPTGLTLASNGTLSGIPTQAGTFPIVVTVTDGGGCPGTGAPYTLVITCPPIAGVVAGSATICAGSPSSVTVTVTGGTPPYTVTLTNGGGTSSGAGPVLTFPVSPSGSTTYAVQALTDSLACAGAGVGSATVTVVPPATTATAGGAQAICFGTATAPLGGNAPVNGTGSWSVVSGGSGTFSSAADPNATFMHTGGTGPVVLRWTITNPPCAASSATVSVTIQPLPPTPVATSNGPVCPGGTLVLHAQTTAAGATFLWTGPNGFSSTEQSPSVPGFTAAMAGPYSVTVTSGCTSLPATTTVVAHASVPVTGTGPDALCQNGTAPFSVSTFVPSATTRWFVSNQGGSAILVGATDGAAATVQGTAGGLVTVSCEVTNPATGCSNFFHRLVDVTAAPVPAVTAPPSAQAGAEGLVASTPGHPGSSYRWTIANGTITSEPTAAAITFTADEGGVTTLTLVETYVTGCTSKPATAKVNVYAAGGPCLSTPEALCLNQDRFRVKVTWRDYTTGATGAGTAQKLTSDSGYLWFLSAANLELFVKVLDGTTVNGNYWVLFGALTDMEYAVEVTDTVTGAVKSYFNPARTQASVADVTAFAAAGSRAAANAVSGREYGLLASLQAEIERDRREPSGKVARLPRPAAMVAGAAACAPDETALCLHASRFEVSVTWRNYTTGAEGAGRAQPVTSDAGTFWFFSPSNVELAVKVLDGTAVNGRYWVLWGALTDVEYTLDVTDTRTGATKTYHNPPQQLASGSDTSAF